MEKAGRGEIQLTLRNPLEPSDARMRRPGVQRRRSLDVECVGGRAAVHDLHLEPVGIAEAHPRATPGGP